ncbi:MAG: site-specific integrase [Chloroflexota bacterium]|nr:site-specific integrase [Chloroflexota bacterium]
MKPRTKACKGEQLGDPLQGELATYDQVGLFQRSVNQKTAYRYRGALLQYQKALQGNRPTVELSKTFLALLREQNFSPSTLRVYRAALQGFHAWRGESLVFPVRVPYHAPPYIEASVVQSLLTRAKDRPRDYLILLLMAHAGLRRDETVNLRVGGVGEKALRFRGKGDSDRIVPRPGPWPRRYDLSVPASQPMRRCWAWGRGVIYHVVKKCRPSAIMGHK